MPMKSGSEEVLLPPKNGRSHPILVTMRWVEMRMKIKITTPGTTQPLDQWMSILRSGADLLGSYEAEAGNRSKHRLFVSEKMVHPSGVEPETF